jgi:biotin-dependent carboxylase-like uncharacterized protein
MNLLVLDPGPIAAVQDLGRPGFGSLGVPIGGAADRVALRLGNRLLGNADTDAAIEFTLGPAVVQFNRPARIVLAGAPCAATAEPKDQPDSRRLVPHLTPTMLPANTTLRLNRPRAGVRILLCIAGGVRTPVTLGSRSTLTPAGLGTFITAHTHLPIADHPSDAPRSTVNRAAIVQLARRVARRTFMVVPFHSPGSSPAADAALRALCNAACTVSPDTNRVGSRLHADSPLPQPAALAHSEPTTPGMIQITPDGAAIVLGPDAAPTGGYPVVATLISAHRDALAQRKPGDVVRFRTTTLNNARDHAHSLTQLLDTAAPSPNDAPWPPDAPSISTPTSANTTRPAR